MESSSIMSFNQKEFVSISANAKSINTRQHEILDSIAFELRTPVTVMKSNIQLLKKCCIGSGNPFVEESFLMCEDSVDNILRFINCVSFLSDTDQGRLKLKKLNFNLDLFIDQVLEELLQSNFDTKRIQVDKAVSDLSIITDKYLLNRILINLLVNALKFSSSTVELFISEINNQLTLIVRDDGIGIPEEEIRDIFHPFVRASNVKMIRGTGLGLSIVSKVVECLEGSVYVNSSIGKGTEFMVIIPYETTMEVNPEVKRSSDLIPQF